MSKIITDSDEIKKLKVRMDILEKRVDNSLKLEEEDHDLLIKTNIAVEEMSKSVAGALTRRTFFGKLFFKNP